MKAVAFTSVKLAQQDFKVLTEAEQEDAAFDVDQGLEAARLGIMERDELDRKARAKVEAMKSFENRLPQKLGIPAVATATTDANGSYRFDHVPAGAYWVSLDTKLGINSVGWSVKVEVKPGETTKLDLNNTNVDYSLH